MSKFKDICPKSFADRSIEPAKRLIRAEGVFHPYVETMSRADADAPLGFKFHSSKPDDIAREYRVVLDTLRKISTQHELHAFSIVVCLERLESESSLWRIRADVETRSGYAALFDYEYRMMGERFVAAQPYVTPQAARVFI